jgi:uncharacterized protein YihD (DUF1040 family)
MRDPERIPQILDLLHQIWKRDLDLRFNQMIYNLQREYSYLNNDMGKIVEKRPDGYEITGFDLFNLEDDEFINFLKKKANC